MNPTPNKAPKPWLSDDERATLPDIDVESLEETQPRRKAGSPEEDIGSVQRPPADS